MKTFRRHISVLLSLVMVLGMLAVMPAATASADTAYETYAQDTVQGGAVLHCFNWSYNNIKAALPDIARAGYTAVQTSPVQRPKDYNSSWTDMVNQWWKLYQPLGLSIAANGTTWFGTKAELTSLCTEAEKYNIKVVVDIVVNHLGNNGTDGGTYDYINSSVESDLKNRNYYHTNNTRINENSRYNITQYHLGMPDLNTGNSYVQQRAQGLLEECISCGVDGFRFDAAKHIEVPTDSSDFASDFWPNILNGATAYAEQNGYEKPFYYGEILGSAGPNFGISNYTGYMAVTDNQTGDRALDKAYWTAADELADANYMKGASAEKSVLWVESHDTYMGNSGSAGFSNTRDITSDVLTKAWAIVGARADSTSLFFARPNEVMGSASTDTTWKSNAVAEINKFKNHFNGTNEYLSSSGKTAYIERGTKGIVISKLDGGGAVELSVHQMQDGTYKDQITNNIFTVANGKITGAVGSTGVAVVYNTDDDTLSYITNSKLYLKPNSNWTEGGTRFAMYLYNTFEEDTAWVSMTDEGDGYYSADVPSGNWTNVIFCRMDPQTTENSWGNKWNQTSDLYPDSGKNCYTVAEGEWDEGDGTWSVYGVEEETTETQAPSTEPESDTYTVYAINNAGWNKVNIHYWGDGETSWPGANMTAISGTKVYKYDVPKNVTGIVFTNGASSSTKQTVDITTGIKNGAVWTVNATTSGTKYTVTAAPDYYLVGSMNGWAINNSYKFTLSATDSGAVEYKLSNVELDAGDEVKVRSSSDAWYPEGDNYAVTKTDAYDIYFRPNGDGNSDWYSGSESNKYYFCLVNLSSLTVTWKDGDGNTLKTDKVPYGETPVYSGATPTKTETAQYTYTFNNTWSPAVAPVKDDVTYTAQFTPVAKTFTVTWKNYDGTVLETDENVAYGSKPSYNGETPSRANEGSTTYSFSGWSPQITEDTVITDDTTFTARFGTNTKTYTIRWFDGDGKLLETDTCIEGVTPQYKGETPTKTADAQYTYTFNHTWDPALVAADRDTDYVAQFDTTVNQYTITWKDGNGEVLKTEEVDYGTTPSYTGETPTKASDADHNYTFNNTWSPSVTSVTGDATYTAQFDAVDIPTYNVKATNVIDWSNVYIYYWTDYGNNSWPGVRMTPDDDSFIWSADIPSNAKGIVFNNGSNNSLSQTVDVTQGIKDGAQWAILNEKDTTETSKYKVHAVPDYYLVGTMTSWGTEGAPVFVPHKSTEKVEEYELTTTLSKNDEIKVREGSSWYPDGSNNNYVVSADGTYSIYFRPNADGPATWHYNVLSVKNVTQYTITWKDGSGNTLKTDTVTHGDTPEYDGAAPTKAEDADFTYTFSGWTPEITAATENTTYTAAFNAVAKFKRINYIYNVYNESTAQKAQKTITKNISYMDSTVDELIALNMPYIKSAYLKYGAYTYAIDGTDINVTVSDSEKKYKVTLNGSKVGEYSFMQTAELTADGEKAFVVDGKVVYIGESYSFFVASDMDITTETPTSATVAEYAGISLNTINIADGRVTLDLLATANIGDGSFERMGIAFALSEKTASEIKTAVEAVPTGTGTQNKIAVHNSQVDYANQSGQYQFRYAPYFSIDKARDATIYFYTYVVDKNGSVKVSEKAQYNMSNLLA